MKINPDKIKNEIKKPKVSTKMPIYSTLMINISKLANLLNLDPNAHRALKPTKTLNS